MSEFQVGQLVQFKGAEVTITAIDNENEMAVVGSGYWEEFSRLAPLEPRPGDTVRVVEIAEYDGTARMKVGDEFPLLEDDVRERYSASRARLESNGPFLLAYGTHSELPSFVRVILLRRAGTPAAEAVRYYGTMPEKLPKTLPAGTKWKNSHYEGEFTGAATLVGTLYGGSMLYRGLSFQPSPAAEVAKGEWPSAGMPANHQHGGPCTLLRPNPELPERGWIVRYEHGSPHVGRELPALLGFLKPISPPPVALYIPKRGETVRVIEISPKDPTPGVELGDVITLDEDSHATPSCPGYLWLNSTYCRVEKVAQPAGGGSSVVRVDPYKKHAADLELLPDMQRIKMRLWFEKEDKLAASRRAKLEQAMRDLDRPVSSHPRSFPERAFFDADELYPTY